MHDAFTHFALGEGGGREIRTAKRTQSLTSGAWVNHVAEAALLEPRAKCGEVARSRSLRQWRPTWVPLRTRPTDPTCNGIEVGRAETAGRSEADWPRAAPPPPPQVRESPRGSLHGYAPTHGSQVGGHGQASTPRIQDVHTNVIGSRPASWKCILSPGFQDRSRRDPKYVPRARHFYVIEVIILPFQICDRYYLFKSVIGFSRK